MTFYLNHANNIGRFKSFFLNHFVEEIAMSNIKMLFSVTAMLALAGCATQQQQVERTTSYEPVIIDQECHIVGGKEVCRTPEKTSEGNGMFLNHEGRLINKPRIPSEIGAAVGKADAARRLAAAEIIAACLDAGGRPEACAQAAAPYSGVAGGSSGAGATGYQGYQGQIQPYRGQQQRPRGCQSTWSMFPSLC